MIENSKFLPKLKGEKGCFGENTKIEVENGYKLIKELKIGDSVASFDCKGDVTFQKVTQIFKTENQDLYRYFFWNGKFIDCTPNHWILNQFNTFACVGSFTTQDCGVDARGHLIPFLRSEYIGKSTVYNFHVEKNCTFFANEIRVHNGGIDPLILRGKKGGKGGGGYPYVEFENTAQSETTAKLLEVISCGEIVGLVNGAKSIFLDETPLQNSDGSYNFRGVSYQIRTGTADQNVIPGFETLNTEVNVGVEVKQQSPVVRNIQTTDVKGITIKIGFPQGLSYLDTFWNQLKGTAVSMSVLISYDNTPYIKIGDIWVNEKTMSSYEKAFYFPIRKSDEVNIKIVRNTADSTNANLRDQCYFNGYTLHSGYSLNYPNVALIGFTVKAKEFGSNLPNRYLHIKGLIMQVPSNYNPQTRDYKGIWDGKFKRAYTNNPAWFIWWILTDKINGVGGDIPDWAISKTKWDLYEIAKRCDELVPNGKGGYEPRFTFNAWITDRKKVFEYLSLICGTCSTLCYWNANSIGFSQDRPADIERVFNNTNVIDGKFNYSETALQSQHTVARVAWHDIDNFCKATYEIVEDIDGIYKQGRIELDIALLGCTSRGQAHRAGAFALFSEKYEDRTVSFKVSLDNADIQIGDIIGISDTNFQGISYSGRITKVENRTVFLDRVIDFKNNVYYQVIISLSDGTSQKVGIINPAISTNTIEISEDLRTSVVVGAVFAIVSTELVPQEYRILDISEDENTVFSISAVKYDSRKYDYIERGYVLPLDDAESLIPHGKLKQPINLVVSEYLYMQSNGSVLSACGFSWKKPLDARVSYYEVRYKLLNENGLYNNLGLTSSVSVDIKDLQRSFYQFEVRSVSDLGLKSAWSVIKFEVIGVEMPLPNVTGLTTVYKDNRINLSWNAIVDIRNFKYQIRKGLIWSEAMIVGETTNLFFPLTSNGIFQVKAIFDGAESPTPAIIEVESVVGETLTGNVIARIDERADGWNGVYNSSDFTITSENYLLLASGGGDVYNVDNVFLERDIFYDTYSGIETLYTVNEDKAITLSSNNVCNIGVDFEVLPIIRNNGIFEDNQIFTNSNIYGVIYGSDYYLRVEICVRKNGEWGEWLNFSPNDYIGDGFKFRFRVKATPSIILYIKNFKISVDVPDRREYWKNLLIPENGLQLNFEPPFNGTPAIVATIIQAGGLEDVLIEDELINKNGAFIRVVDKSGNNVQKYLNILAEGY